MTDYEFDITEVVPPQATWTKFPPSEDRKPFITIEGIDGVGKSTVISSLDILYDDVRMTREPWEGKHRDMIFYENNPPISDFFGFLTDRSIHNKWIRNHLYDQGKQDQRAIVCDRYIHSTLAYQRHALEDAGYGSERLKTLLSAATVDVIWPDLTIWLDLPAEKSVERTGKDKYEKREFLEKVSETYRELYEETEYMERVDASQSKAGVASDCVALIEERFSTLE